MLRIAADAIEQFTQTVEKLNGLYRELLDVENNKSYALMTNNTENLDALVNQEQSFLMHFSTLDSERIARQKQMGLENFTITQISEMADEPYMTRLTAAYAFFLEVMSSLVAVNSLNKNLLENRLEFVDRMVGEIGGGAARQERSVTARGTVKKHENAPSVFDRTI